MKGYYESKRLRMAGKGWEVREKLRQIRREADDPSATLAAWLEAAPAKAAGQAPAGSRPAAAAAAYSPFASAGDCRSYPMV